jgi:hypothetical protein
MAEQPLVAPPNIYGAIPQFSAPAYKLPPLPELPQVSQPESAPLDTGSATVKYSPSLDSFYVNGRTFKADDETQKVKSLEYFNDPTPRPAPQGDWVSLDTAGYLGHVREITDPGLWRLLTRNFGIGVDNLQQLAGYGLQLAGAETLGKSIVEQQAQDLAKVEPYQRSFGEIGSSPERGVTDWFVANLAQIGPNLLESLVTTALGYAGGSAAGGGINPLTGAAGAIAGLVGKGAIKKSLAEITAKVIANNELKAAGKAIVALTDAETQVLKTAAGIAGGAAASIANSYAMGASDTYGETVQAGAPNRLAAILAGLPYAALDLFPEAVLANKLFGGALKLNSVFAEGALKLGNKAFASIPTVRGKAGELLKRGVVGGGLGGLLEGSTEAGQELLLLAANPNEDFESDSGKLRVLNAFAAGFGMGGTIGAPAQILTAGKLKAGKATDVLAGGNPDPTATPALPPPPQPGDAGYNEGETDPFMQARREQMFAPTVNEAATPAPLPTLDPFADRRRAFLGEPAVIIPQGQANLMQNLRDISSGAAPPAAPQSIAQPNLLTQPRLPAQPVQTALPPQGNMMLQQLQNLIPQQVAPATNPLMAARMSEALASQQQAQQKQAAFEAGLQSAAAFQQQARQQQDATRMQQEIAQYNAPAMPEPTAIPEAAAPRVPTTQPTQMSLPGMAPPKSKFLQRGVQAQPVVQESYGPSAQIPFDFNQPVTSQGAVSPVGKPQEGVAPSPKPKQSRKSALSTKGTNPNLSADPNDTANNLDESVKKDQTTIQSAVDIVALASSGDATSSQYVTALPDRSQRSGPSYESVRSALKDKITQALKTNPDITPFLEWLVRYNLTTELKDVLASATNLPDNMKSVIDTPSPVKMTENMMEFQGFVSEMQLLVSNGGIDPTISNGIDWLSLESYVSAIEDISKDPSKKEVEAKAAAKAWLASDFRKEVDALIEKGKPKNYATRTVKGTGGLFLRLDGTPISEPMVIGRVKMFVVGMVRKFANTPTVHVFKNVADLKATNPKLFERANAAREAGDFATTQAVGYSFGKDIIIFSDFVQTEQQLKFVLAHEALGHFGFRSIMSDANLKSMLNQAYNQDSEVRNAADNLIDLHGMNKLEAIEEVLAQRAAELDTSTIRRVWNFIKNALNRMGFEFDDDAARMLIHQSRMYVRRGITGNFFTDTTILSNIADMSRAAIDGRFSRVADNESATFASAASIGINRWSNEGRTTFDGIREFFTSPDKLQQAVKITADIFSTLDQKARHSEGLTKIYNLFKSQNNLARNLISQLENMTKFTSMGSIFGGPSAADLAKAGQYLAQARMYMLQSIKPGDIEKYDNLFILNGSGYPTLNKVAADKLMADGLVTADQFRKGFQIKNALGEVQETVKENIDENGKAWKVYLEQRAVVNKAALDKLEQTYLSAQYQQSELVNDVLKGLLPEDTSATQAEVSALKAIIKQYRSILESDIISAIGTDKVEPSASSQEMAKDFLYEVTRAFYNANKMQDWLSPQAGNTEKAATTFATPEYDKVRAALTTLQRMKISDEKTLGNVQQHIANSVFSEVDARNAEMDAKTTIRTSYAPLIHRGKYEVRLVAYDKNGNPVQLAEAWKDIMPTPRADSIEEVNAIIDGWENKKTKKKEDGLATIWEGKDFNVVNSDGVVVPVRFRVESGKAAVNRSVGESGDFSNFVNFLARTNVSITPQERERLVVAMTKQGDSRRSRLKFSGNPGWNADVVGSIADHVETSSHVAAKIRYRRQTDAVMLNRAAWDGDMNKLKALRLAVNTETNQSKKAQAVREYNDYAYKYVYSAPTRRPAVDMLKEDGSVAKTIATRGEGRSYFNEASALIEWHGQQLDTANAVEDYLSGTTVSRLKTAIVTMQLGGSIATAMVNLLSLGTHSLNYLATYNPERSYGLGYGYGKAMSALTSAGKDVGNYKLADSDYLTKMVEKPWSAGERRSGMTEDEAKYLLNETLTGSLQPSEANTLLGTKRGGIRNGNLQAGIRGYMSMFTYTEAYNRRTTALATYRLEKERALAEGLTESEARARARTVTSRTIDMTQGNYAMYVRPRIAYGGVGSLLFMYKQFVVLTLGMMRNLSPSGRTVMIGTILMLSGLKGIPFADDLLDLADFLMQTFGIKKKSAEGEIMHFLNSIAPGLTPYAMRGLIDSVTGATISSRAGFGDIIPLSGAFNYGADPAREIQNFAGPIIGGVMSLATNAKDIASYAAEVVGLKPDTTSIKDIMRKSPLAGIRALSDTLTYYQDGKITTSDGKVVSKNVGPSVLVARLLGFMPAETTKVNDIIRISKGGSAYVAAVKKEFVDAYRKAAVANDRADMNRVRQSVRDFNIDAKGTGFEIKDFEQAAKKATKEAMSPSSVRYLRTAPKGIKQDVIDYLNMYGLDVKDGAVQ